MPANRPVHVCQLEEALARLFDSSLAQRADGCRKLSTLFASSAVITDEQLSLEKELAKALLMQLVAFELRLLALEALGQMPRWDAEVLNRAVRIPPFQKEEEDPKAQKRTLEPWYGALFFVLDDEDQQVRAAALKVLQQALCSKIGDGKVPEVAGLFQRLAQIASLCLHDHAELVRNQSAVALVEVMTSRNVALTSAGSLKDAPTLETVLEAFPRAPCAVMRVLKNSRFADLDTVQAAVRWMVSVEHSDESEVQAVARHLAVELRRKEEEPAPKRRKGRMKLDTSLVAGTRFLTASILHGDDPVAPAGLAVGLALARGAKDMERLETLLQSLAKSCDVRSLRGPDAFGVARSSGAGEEMRDYIQLLEDYWKETLDLVEEPNGFCKSLRCRALIKKLSQLQKARQTGSFSQWLCWAEVLKCLCEASLLRDEDDEGLAARQAAVKLHQAVSWLMHGFKWPVIPRVLLAFRLRSLQFLDVPADLSQDKKRQIMASLLEDGTCPLLSLSDCESHYGKLSLPNGERWSHPRNSEMEQTDVLVNVDSSIDLGLRVKPFGQHGEVIEVPPSFGGSRSRRVVYPLSCEMWRPVHLQLYLDVDAAAGEATLASGSTCVKDGELHRLVNMIPLGEPLELHLNWT